MSKKLDQSLVDAYASIYEARRGHAAGSSDLEKQASQLASDVRYKAKGRVKEGTNREELKKIYLGLIQSSPAPNVVKQMAKKKLIGEGYISEEGYDVARDMGRVKPSKDKKDATTMQKSSTQTEKQKLERQKKGDEALDSVIASLRKKYGKNAVMDMSKKKKKVDEGFIDFIKNPKKTIQKQIDKKLTGATKNLNIGSTGELGSVASPNSGTYKEETELQRIQNAIKTKTMNGKPLTDKQIEGLKAGLTQGGNKVEMGEEKKPLPKTKMYRKAGNLSRKALSKGLDSKEGSKAQKRSEKIVSTISTADEKKRFDNMKTKKSELYNDTTGKFRKEWEALKLIETENYREQFDKWLDGIVEEGYDIERWSDEELVDTFINENNLWASREAVDSALLESDKKGKGSGKKDACYHKVKASASVWPSAYASGRLVQCRKKGAANYGKGKK